MAITKKHLRKNRLDLEYHGKAQKANALLILLTTGAVGFIGTFLWLPTSKFYYGITITLILSSIGALAYHKTKEKMSEILNSIEKL